jgi:plasmid maintenance system killer protein
LNILFRDKNFHDDCIDLKRLKKHQGAERGKKIMRRLDDLKAADDLNVLSTLPGRCHELKGDRHGQLSLDLDGPWRLIFLPADQPPALKPDGGMDWKNVRTIEILGIEDTHE